MHNELLLTSIQSMSSVQCSKNDQMQTLESVAVDNGIEELILSTKSSIQRSWDPSPFFTLICFTQSYKPLSKLT